MRTMLQIDAGMPPLRSPEVRLAFLQHYAEASRRRLEILHAKEPAWFEEEAAFFDVRRTRAWILLRRFTHSAHHRGQLTVYLRLLGRNLYSTYGPTADTGGLAQNHAKVIYRYDSLEELLSAEGKKPTYLNDDASSLRLEGRGGTPPSSRSVPPWDTPCPIASHL